MPAPRDLLGRRYGKLVVLERLHDEKRGRSKWRCRCDCGQEEIVPDERLPSTPARAARKTAVFSCSACRSQRTCSVCGRVFVSKYYSTVCHDPACKRLNYRANQLAHYYRLTDVDPDLPTKRSQEKIKRMHADPAYAEIIRGYDKVRADRERERRAADPEFEEQMLEKQRDYYARYSKTPDGAQKLSEKNRRGKERQNIARLMNISEQLQKRWENRDE